MPASLTSVQIETDAPSSQLPKFCGFTPDSVTDRSRSGGHKGDVVGAGLVPARDDRGPAEAGTRPAPPLSEMSTYQPWKNPPSYQSQSR